MTKKRNSFARYLAWRVTAFAVALVTVGCATSEAQRAEMPAAQQRAAEPDLTGAHLDKRKFLLAASMLGRSAMRDIELLSTMTGAKVEPKPDKAPSFQGVEKTFQTLIPLIANDRVPGSTSYVYGFTARGDYVPSLAVYLQKEFACIRVEDLNAALGPPERVLTKHPSPHAIKTGPIDVWSIRYVLSGGHYATFYFDTQECAGSLSVNSASNYRK